MVIAIYFKLVIARILNGCLIILLLLFDKFVFIDRSSRRCKIKINDTLSDA